MVLLGLVFLGSAGMLVYTQFQYREGNQAYTEAEELVELPELEAPEELQQEETAEVDPYADILHDIELAALREVNSDVLGWLLIPDTPISYPLVQGSDNDYYLNHTWRKTASSVGSIFMDYRSSSDLRDFHTIVYGHRMRNGTMFASLKYYNQQSYWEAHPRIYIANDAGIYVYEIFSAYEAGVTEDTYHLSFADDGEKQAFLDFCMGQSDINTGIVSTVEDHVLTLSTCTGRGHATRWVVQAVLVEAPA